MDRGQTLEIKRKDKKKSKRITDKKRQGGGTESEREMTNEDSDSKLMRREIVSND